MDYPTNDVVKTAHDLALLCVKRQLDDGSVESDPLSVFEAYKIAYGNLYGYLTKGA